MNRLSHEQGASEHRRPSTPTLTSVTFRAFRGSDSSLGLRVSRAGQFNGCLDRTDGRAGARIRIEVEEVAP